MENKPEEKGTTPASFVGTVFIIYAVWMSAIAIASITTFSPWHLLLVGMSVAMVIAGIGLLKHNYYAWLVSTVFTAIKVVVGIAQIILSFSKGNPETGSQLASQMGWPLLIVFLLYRSRFACTKKHGKSELLIELKRNFPALMAVTITVATLLVATLYGNGGTLLVLGLPLLAIEFGVVYLIGSNMHRRCGWS
ncbi:MAG: hypothetical protein PHP53_24685 [Prolixibacteraceae bacterium]|nr:hypothetical protein [Prolixibacteraceae bacterium]